MAVLPDRARRRHPTGERCCAVTDSDIDGQTDFGAIDFFTSPAFVPDPQPYFEYLRSQGPVVKESHHGVVAVTGMARRSRCSRTPDSGPTAWQWEVRFRRCRSHPRATTSAISIDAHRTQMPLHEHMVAMDPPNHTRARSLLTRLLTPSRLKANQDFLWELADSQLDEFVDSGECEFLTAYSKPFSLLAIADLLGVPREDHKEFRDCAGEPAPDGQHRGRCRGDQPAGVPRREVQRLHRRAPRRATRRRAE